MLRKIDHEETKKYLDFAYSFAMNPRHSSYPLFSDGIKTKEEFEKYLFRSALHKDYETLLFFKENKLHGLIQFFTIKEDSYLQLSGFYLDQEKEQAMSELLEYLSLHYAGYDLYFGFPSENRDSIEYLEHHGFSLIEESYHNILKLSDVTPREPHPCVVEVQHENFSDFALLHQVDEEQYWTSERILESLDQWSLFILYEHKLPIGAIYQRHGEIYGIDYSKGEPSETTYTLLVQAVLDHLKKEKMEHLIFFHDHIHQPWALKLGFHCLGKYMLYYKKSEGK